MRFLFLLLSLTFTVHAESNPVGQIVEADCKLDSDKVVGEVHLKRVFEDEVFNVQLGDEHWSLAKDSSINMNEQREWNYLHATLHNSKFYAGRLLFKKTADLKQQQVEAVLVLSSDFMISYPFLCKLKLRELVEQQVCSRTPAVVSALEQMLGKQCSEMTAEDLTTIQKLELNQKVSSGTLKKEDFAGLINLEKLNLTGANLSSFPVNLFAEIPQLKELTLDSNPIKSLPDGLFKDLKNLVTLNLRSSFYSAKDFRLTEATFAGLRNLKTLDLNSNPGIFEDFTFRHLSNLKFLDISTSSIKTITENTFAGLESLESLNLWQSQSLKEISPLAFQHLGKLTYLNFGNNGIKEMPSGLLQPLVNLQTLILYVLQSLNDQSFTNLNNLKSLSLDVSTVADVTHILDPLENLEDLRFVAGRMNNFSGQMFSHLKKLKKLKMSVGTAFDLPDYSFSHLENLEELNLGNSFAALTIADYTFTGLKKLRKLDLHGNHFYKFIPWSFNDLTSLEVLDLSENQISHIFGLQINSLKELNLVRNNLDNIDQHTFRDFKNLQILRLSSNNIRYIQNGTFAALENIKRIELSSNQLQNVTEQTVSGINVDKIEFIDFIYNALTSESKKFLKERFGNKVRIDTTKL